MGLEMMVGLALSMASSAMQLKSQNDAIEAQAEADVRQAESDMKRASEVAQENTAQAVRDSDAAMATMIVGMGGTGGINTARSAVEIGFNEGINLARIEGNRKRGVASASNLASDSRRAAGIQGQAAGVSFIGDVASTGFNVARDEGLFD